MMNCALARVRGDFHLHGHLDLVFFTMPSPITKNQKVQTRGFGICDLGSAQCIRQETADHSRLRSDEQNANKFTPGLFHTPTPKLHPFRLVKS